MTLVAFGFFFAKVVSKIIFKQKMIIDMYLVTKKQTSFIDLAADE